MIIQPAAGAWSNVSNSGTSPSFTITPGTSGQVTLLASVTSVASTGNPTIQVYLDVSDGQGGWFAVTTPPMQTAIGIVTSNGNPAAATALAAGVYRFRWAITGTNPVFGLVLAAVAD